MIEQDGYLFIYLDNLNSISILDCSNPLSIIEEARFTGFGDIHNFGINNSYLYTVSGNNFSIYHFENFSSLEKLDSFYNESYNFINFNIKGNYTYVLDENIGFVVLDIANKTNIQFIDKYDLSGNNYYSAFFITMTICLSLENLLTRYLFIIYQIH